MGMGIICKIGIKAERTGEPLDAEIHNLRIFPGVSHLKTTAW